MLESTSGEEGFLSFEDWKRLNLLRSSEIVEDRPKENDLRQAREAPQPRGQHGDQSIDSIGDEIDIQMSSSSYGQTSKERFNYASFDCAAAVLKANPEAKGSSSILDENRDRYMLNKCGASTKFVIVELCEDILVDTVVLANLEFFSSTFKDFRVSVSDRYPIQEREWKTLGTFLANNTRTLQVFAIKNPLIWARYVRIEFLSHFGNEFYCPLTLLRVHGTTMMEEYKIQEGVNQEKPPKNLEEAIIASQKSIPESGITSDSLTTTSSIPEPSNRTESLSHDSRVDSTMHVIIDPTSKKETIENGQPQPSKVSTATAQEETSVKVTPSVSVPVNASNGTQEIASNSSAIETTESRPSPSIKEAPTSVMTEISAQSSLVESIAQEKDAQTTSSFVNPTTQESVYKTITKRLSLLEANATLSLRYIEEQSQLLRDVFSKMERRHSQKIDSFLAELNSTLAGRLLFFVSRCSRGGLISLEPTV